MIFDDEKFVKKLNETLKNGGVVAYVTDTVWGIGCLPQSIEGADRIYEIKGRDRSKPLILMSDRFDNLKPYVKNIPAKAYELVEKHFPGALTLIFEKTEKTPDAITSNKNTVGVRVPDNSVFKRMCEVIEGHVLATTSANLSNHPSAKNYEEAKAFIGDYVDYVFEDYGDCAKGLESTVALALSDDIKVLRQGRILL